LTCSRIDQLLNIVVRGRGILEFWCNYRQNSPNTPNICL